MIFLASIPRSGSTLLASLLGQRPDTYVSPTSNLDSIMGAVVTAYTESPETLAGQCGETELCRTLKGVAEAKYGDRNESIIIDKGRGWPNPQNMETMEKVLGEPVKIIATVRPMSECLASFFEIDKNATDIKYWIKTSHVVLHLMESYTNLKEGYERYPKNFCLVEYGDLCSQPQTELDRVAKFLGVDTFQYNPIIEQVKEDDNIWGIKDLHKLGSTIEKTEQDTKGILGEKLFNFYQGGEFWNDKPEPVKEKKPIDMALEASLRGDHNKSYRILKQEELADPTDDRVAFNLGWHEMERGNLLAGHKLLNRGRNEGVFGNLNINSSKPRWNGERGVTVLMTLEAGLGDQIHSIRYANNVAKYGNKVVVSGSVSLAPILKDCEGVSAFSQEESALGIYHDYWLPAMSAGVPLNLEYSDLSGVPYIKRTKASEGKIGIKWAGNPDFEHQQYRIFPEELMFDAVGNTDCMSLQKEGEIPYWLEKPSLDSWDDTRDAISRCDLVISSCTSIAHLSAAMGIETWIVVPILSYYLWALSGDTTPYYDCVKLFRQEKYGSWNEPFKKIKELISLKNLKNKENFVLTGSLPDPVFM